MKQHITEKELEKFCEENENEATKLIKIISKDIDFIPLGTENLIFAEKVNIGKMIEILEQDNKLLDITNTYHPKHAGWGIIINGKEIKSQELCDALWEAVKTIL